MEKIKNWFHKPVYTIVCYVISLLLALYSIYGIKTTYDYIASVVSQGTITWGGDFMDILSYFLSQNMGFIFYAFAFAFFGKVISILKPKKDKAVVEVVEEEVDEFLED